MKRLNRMALLISLVEALRAHESWCGETHIQKAVYFLQEVLDLPLGMNFILYKHGPFSFDLSDELTAMQVYRLLQDQPRPYPYGPSLLPGKGSQNIKALFPRTLAKYSRQIEFIADKLGDSNAARLERLATALYVTSKWGGNKTERAKQVNMLKPHVSFEDALLAVEEVDEIIKDAQRL